MLVETVFAEVLRAFHAVSWWWIGIAAGELLFWVIYWRIEKGPPRDL